jgi:Flp pilus assembly protein TadG
MVTAELAACLPVLMVVLAVALTAVSAVAKRARLQDAAREAARAAARGDDTRASALAQQVAPHSRVIIRRTAAEVDAVVTASIHPFGGWLPGMTISERAVAAIEQRGGSP